jgi:hypothetical protein
MNKKVAELAEALGCKPSAVKVYMRELFPGLAWPEADTAALRETIARKKKALYETIITQAKICLTHDEIAAGIGISGRLLRHLLGGHVFVGRTASEDGEEETRVMWPHAGISLNKGRLEAVPYREKAKSGALLSYPSGMLLERGVRP